MKLCLNCGNEVKNKYCNNKCQLEYQNKQNPVCVFNVRCYRCDKEFLISERKNSFPKKKIYYCSKKCSNKRKQSDEIKEKISIGVKKAYLNDITYKNRCRNNNKRNKVDNGNYSKIEKNCIGCGKMFLTYQCTPHRKFCTRKCYNENITTLSKIINPNSGGYRGSSPNRGKGGWYKDYWCDSSWELAWVIYNLDHEIKFERNNEKFTYFYKGKNKNYIPDFKIDNTFIEIKGYENDKDRAKFEYFPHNLIILRRKEMYNILKYVRKQYGWRFIKLYESKRFTERAIV